MAYDASLPGGSWFLGTEADGFLTGWRMVEGYNRLGKEEGVMDIENLQELLAYIANDDVEQLVEADRNYGPSWCKRGGQQAFAVIWRKVDRIENILKNMDNGYDIFEAWEKDPGNIRDDIGDLRRYLLLLEEYLTRA